MSTLIPIRVVATAGDSPAVLTELAWWAATNGYQVAAIRVWTTGRCRPRVDAHLDLHWEALRAQEGPERLPPRSRVGVADLQDDAGGVLDDVRTSRDADLVADQIHRELQRITEHEPHVLVGWFAGGRKTMSSALQSAMTLFGRARDELWHVLVDESVPKTFAFPGPGEGHLVDVSRVPFVAVTRHLMPTAGTTPLGDVWRQLREFAREAAGVRATLAPRNEHRERQRRVLTFQMPDRSMVCCSLGDAQAELYARLVSAGRSGVRRDVIHSKQLERLRSALQTLDVDGRLRPFHPHPTITGEYWVPAFHEVDVQPVSPPRH